MIHTLDFEFFYEGKTFMVTFDTEGAHPLQSFLVNITMDGYPIDDITLHTSHKILYAMIETRMRKVAEDFWSRATISEKALSMERKEKFEKMPSLNGIMDVIHDQICKPYNDEIINAPKNPFL